MEAVHTRSGGRCELCGSESSPAAHPIDEGATETHKHVLLCDTCLPAITSAALLDDSRWFCLQESVWSEVTAVQVLSFRLLHRTGGASWATELLDQVYLEDDVRVWAESGLESTEPSGEKPVDSNGTILLEGDSVTLIKDLEVKGAGFTAKRGTLVKNIRVGDDPTHIEGRVNKTVIMLKTCFLKRVT
jgi:protein PhnA